MIVVKVGGSLYDLPDLGERLARFFASLDDDVILVPGGGKAADVIREWDRIHHLDASASHWLAIQAMDLAGCMLQQITYKKVLNVQDFLYKHNVLPCNWQVTSDSIAALVADIFKASLLVLLKSTLHGHSIVDDYFHCVARNLNCPARIVNLRQQTAGPWPDREWAPIILPNNC